MRWLALLSVGALVGIISISIIQFDKGSDKPDLNELTAELTEHAQNDDQPKPPDDSLHAAELQSLNIKQSHNRNFDQRVKCTINDSCLVPFFLLSDNGDSSFSATALDVLEVNRNVTLSTLDDRTPSMAILGESAHFSDNVSIGNLYSYLPVDSYDKLIQITKQPAAYDFKPHKATDKDVMHLTVPEGSHAHLRKNVLQSVSLSKSSTLELIAGQHYFIDNLTVDDHTTIVITEENPTNEEQNQKNAMITIFGQTNVIPKIKPQKPGLGVIILVLNTNSISASQFNGLLLCPYCFLTIENSGDSDFHGQVYSRSIRINPNTSITHKEHDIFDALSMLGDLSLHSHDLSDGHSHDSNNAISYIEENPFFNSGSERVDALILEHLGYQGGYGLEAVESYHASLERLREESSIVAPTLYRSFSQLQPILENQAARWSIVQTLSALETDYGLESLMGIASTANTPRQYGYSGAQAERFIMEETQIRFRAIEGISILAKNGNLDAQEALFELATNTERGDQNLAASYYLQALGDQARANLEQALPDFSLDDLR